VIRLTDGNEFARIAEAIDHPRHGFDPFALAGDPENVILIEGNDVALFEGEGSVYTGHYFFTEARGRNALNLAQRMIDELFDSYGAVVIKGLTPVDNKAALWITRQLGFESHGVVSHAVGDFELFTLSRNSL
jgi:hypothetical protein